MNAADSYASSGEEEGIAQFLKQEALPELIHSISKKRPASHREAARSPHAHDAQARKGLPYLLEAYQETSDEGIRCKLIQSIGDLQEPSLFQWLAKRLDDPSIKIQCFAIWALGELQTSQAVDPLLQKLWSPDPYVKMIAIDALGKTGRNAYVATELMTFLQEDDAQIRFITAQALYAVAGPDAAPELMQDLLHEPSLDVQEALTLTLAHSGGSVAAAHFIELLKNPLSPAMEHWAMMGLQAAGPSVVIPELAPLLDGDHFQWKISAAQILSQLDVPPDEPLEGSWVGDVERWAAGRDLIARQGAAALLLKIQARNKPSERNSHS